MRGVSNHDVARSNHAASRKRVPDQPEAGFFHHINGVFATDIVASACIGGLTRIWLKIVLIPRVTTRVTIRVTTRVITSVVKGVAGCPLFAGHFGLNDARTDATGFRSIESM
jgi:hypothetical protein